MQENDNTILRVEHLSKSFGDHEVLKDINFDVKQGEVISVIGSSGSGKSTLLHVLGGVEKPSDGRVVLDGQNIYRQNEEKLAIFRRRQIGIIYQFYNLIPTLTVEENIALPLLMDGRTVDKDWMKEILKKLGMEDRANHLPRQLSGGQQQRVTVGRALINSPAVILADEPTGNLDRKNSQEIIAMLKASSIERKQTLIIITHDESIALQADRIISIEDGQIISDEVLRK